MTILFDAFNNMFAGKGLKLKKNTCNVHGLPKTIGINRGRNFYFTFKGLPGVDPDLCPDRNPARVLFHARPDYSFSYRITIPPIVFVIAAHSGMLVALLTVSYQTVKASNANAVDTLRNE